MLSLRLLGRWWFPLLVCAATVYYFTGSASSLRKSSPSRLLVVPPSATPPPETPPAAARPLSTFTPPSNAMSESNTPPPDFLTVKPREKHSATVIFIHGLGDSGEGWEPVAQMLGRSNSLAHVKWILPHAPNQPVTVNGGMRMPSWYDIYSFEGFGPDRKEDEKGMLRSRDSILALVKKEIEDGIPQERIVVGGFSQGSVVTQLVGYTSPYKFAGLVVASGYMPFPKKIKDLATPHAIEQPVFWAHGKADPLIPYNVAESSLSIARAQLGFSNAEPGSTAGIEFHAYEGMGHSANEEEIVALGQWLARVVPK